MAATVGELNIKLNIELERLDAQIRQANGKIAGMSKTWGGDISKAARSINSTLATIGVGASLSGLVAFGKECIALGGRITDLSSQANLSVTAFQNMELAAMDNGTTGEEVAAVFAKLGNAIQDAVEDPASKAAKAFDKLRLGASALKTMEGQQAYELLGRSIANASDKQEAYNALADILGQKIGPKQLQLLQAMAEQGYDKIAEGYKKMVMTPEQIKQLAEAEDALSRLGRALTVIGGQTLIGAEVVFNPTEAQALAKEYARVAAGGNEGADVAFFRRLFGSKEEFDKQAKEREEKLKDILARYDALVNPAKKQGLSSDPATLAAEEKARAAAEQNSLDALNLSILKATTEAEKDQAEVKKANDAYATAYNKTLSETDEKMRGYAEAAMSAIDPTNGLAKEIAGIQAAADYGVISVENATAAIDKLTEAAGEADLDSFLSGMNAEYADEIKEVNAEAARAKRLADDIGDAFGDAFESAILDGKKFGDVLKSLARDILALIVRQTITAPIASGISGMLMGGVGAGAGGGLFGGLFGGGKAVGGDVNPSEWYMVGEKGPEPFIPSTAGTIVSNSDLMSALGAEQGGGTSITVVQNFAAGVSQSQLAESMRQTREAAKSGVMDAIQRRGGGFGMVAA